DARPMAARKTAPAQQPHGKHRVLTRGQWPREKACKTTAPWKTSRPDARPMAARKSMQNNSRMETSRPDARPMAAR
ncbi:MAG: hypothetical protein IKS20_04220, partial [Victivallales bacterium]|nr:hypothetical protein [Victivallales bacterium]